MKSGSLKFLEHSGPVQACNGIALHLPLLTEEPLPVYSESNINYIPAFIYLLCALGLKING